MPDQVTQSREDNQQERFLCNLDVEYQIYYTEVKSLANHAHALRHTHIANYGIIIYNRTGGTVANISSS